MSKTENLFYKILNIKSSITVAFSVLIGLMVSGLQQGNYQLAMQIVWPYLIFLMVCFLLFPLFTLLHRYLYVRCGLKYPGLSDQEQA